MISWRVAVVGALLCGVTLARGADPQKPRARFEQPIFDFGTVTQGSKVAHEFTVKNEGDADLLIQRVVPSCGCTAAAASSEPIKPGQEGKIRVEFDTTGFYGEKLKTVRVNTNDLDDPSAMLTLKGIVQPDVVIEPANLIFNEVVRGASPPQSRVVTAVVREGAKVEISEVRAFSRYIQIQESESGPRKKVFRVVIDPSSPLGELRERVVLSLSGAKETSINIPVLALVKGQFVLTPAQVSFGVIEGDKEIVRSVKLDNLGKTPVAIKSIKTSNPAVGASVKEIEAGKKFVLQVKVDPRKMTRDLRASVDVVTDNPDEPALSLSVYGILPPKQ